MTVPKEFIQKREDLRRGRPTFDDAPWMEFRVPWETADWTTARTLRYTVLMFVVSLLGFVLFRAAGDPSKEFLLLSFLALNTARLFTRTSDSICLLLVLIASFLFGFEYAAYLITPICLLALGDSFTQHNLYFSTSAPTPLAVSDSIRGAFELSLLRQGMVPATTAASLLLLCMNSLLGWNRVQTCYLILAGITVLTALAFLLAKPTQNLIALSDVFRSWWNYNLRDKRFTNVFQSPAGGARDRIAITFNTVLMVSAALASPSAALEDFSRHANHYSEFLQDIDQPRDVAIAELVMASGIYWSLPILVFYALPAAVVLACMVLAIAPSLSVLQRVQDQAGNSSTFESAMERLNPASEASADADDPTVTPAGDPS